MLEERERRTIVVRSIIQTAIPPSSGASANDKSAFNIAGIKGRVYIYVGSESVGVTVCGERWRKR